MFIHATRAVEPGAELCLSYLPDACGATFEQRTERLAEWAGGTFVCGCPRCSLCRSNPKVGLENAVLYGYAGGGGAPEGDGDAIAGIRSVRLPERQSI